MTTQFSDPVKPHATRAGGIAASYLLCAVSFFIYALVECMPDANEKNLIMLFFLHYFMALAYGAGLVIRKRFGLRKSWTKENIDHTMVLLNLFLISAYALNRVVPVFEDSTDWLCAYILCISLTTLSYRFFYSLPHWVNKFQYVVLGSALVFYLYLSLFVAHYYAFGSLGILAFGIGAHVFLPILLFIGSIFLIYHTRMSFAKANDWVIAGAIATLCVVIAFVIEWNLQVTRIETLANQSVMYQDNQLPLWVTVGETIENDWISQRILKSDLVYMTAPEEFGEWIFVPRGLNWQETKKHDPLVFLASLKVRSSLSETDRIAILKSISDARHQTQERLWSGDNLTTSYLVTDIDIYPGLRLAYTEKYLNVRNNGDGRRWWGNTEEAIYTFQLPEGSVVTSLSLWVNGKEEKGILTSRQQASKAYKTIVGVERRDPSVVHWQEGNTVSVRVFPCTTKEERKFKIGITSPLPIREGEIVYKNITFLGPNASRARETTRIRLIGPKVNVHFPGSFVKDKKGDYVSEHHYDPDFEISLKAMPLQSNRFTFDGYTYSLKEYKPEHLSVNVREIYLDINNSWKKSELESLEDLMSKYLLSVYSEGEFVPLNEENWSVLTSALLKRNFSLFPFHLLKDPEQVLVITKGRPLSPHLSDFKDSHFAEDISQFFAKGTKVKVYNLQENLSTYISSLRELRALEFAKGTTEELKKGLADNTFTKVNETDEFVVVHDAQLSISKIKNNDGDLPDTAPDHLARLFAYNNIMRKTSSGYFRDDFINAELVDEAVKAYVVSPVSGLIVLETKEDYERFGIRDQDNSLHNASRQSSGAVPEPHEWALIAMFVLFVIYVKMRQ